MTWEIIGKSLTIFNTLVLVIAILCWSAEFSPEIQMSLKKRLVIPYRRARYKTIKKIREFNVCMAQQREYQEELRQIKRRENSGRHEKKN